ncbi:hypothetical protein L3Y34_019602 [Caenorhabditis briggsae]|uniref:Uncharacterized protein n=1 Tax=Caenorhabditis briggsae TaxID=6238 RepID=A0AAE9DR97_CAEBR|nr:hypothetical protein L3Y34_019602 [Caenorhabditis briggsae]
MKKRNQQKRETFWMDHIPESTDNCMETHSSSFWSRRVDGALKKASGKQRILGHQTASILIHPPPENVGYCLHAIRAQAHEMIVFTKESPEMKIPKHRSTVYLLKGLVRCGSKPKSKCSCHWQIRKIETSSSLF